MAVEWLLLTRLPPDLRGLVYSWMWNDAKTTEKNTATNWSSSPVNVYSVQQEKPHYLDPTMVYLPFARECVAALYEIAEYRVVYPGITTKTIVVGVGELKTDAFRELQKIPSHIMTLEEYMSTDHFKLGITPGDVHIKTLYFVPAVLTTNLDSQFQRDSSAILDIHKRKKLHQEFSLLMVLVLEGGIVTHLEVANIKPIHVIQDLLTLKGYTVKHDVALDMHY
ncbi:hypothetical protein BU23DRAFT_570689 [Bimuria novae-zelandiae CBS 107.79]|uniref:Uncharacterized protein n=1 Tax=Bimuria novae-zelandiae CBS 107.79 TaxID=1447943 RepID=A0A6A5V1G5_9PLEO|nr:hypothetical protein BU23DRAFT_570689 [Bimuria novae-zelandiae CBS 107.79]